MYVAGRADDLTKEGMLKGIEQAAAFILFLSTDVLNRPYCQMEIRHAIKLKKRIILLHGERPNIERPRAHIILAFARSLLRAEADARFGSFDFRAAHAEAPTDLAELLDSTESLVSARA